MNAITRAAMVSDADAIARLYLRARHWAAATGAIPPLAHDDREVRNWIEHSVLERLECWVAEVAPGTTAGMLVLDGDWVDQLYVDPALTRKRIGSQLLDLAKRERPQGLRLWSFASNHGAQRFYERHGFQEVERTDGTRNEEGAPDIRYQWVPAEPVISQSA